MKYSAVILVVLAVLAATPAYGDNPPSQSADRQRGFGLQATIFSRVAQPSSGTMVSNYSVIANYPPTPGDIYTLSINSEANPEIGNPNPAVTSYEVQLSEDMKLDIPYIGQLDATGKTLPQLKQEISTAIKQRVPVQYVNFVLTTPAQFNVFIYGGVNSPGYIVANPLVTVIDAIGIAKGFKPGATYRNIQLIRNGATQALDLSKFYESADFNSNPRLIPGDTIFVPAAEVLVSVLGEVPFPGVYELLPSDTLRTLIDLAGGYNPGARSSRVEVTRVDQGGGHALFDVADRDAAAFAMKNGDSVNVASSSENVEMVSIEGAVFGKARTGTAPIQVPRDPVRIDFPYYPGITVLAILDAVGGPTPFAIPNHEYLIERATGNEIPLQADTLWQTRERVLDHALEPGDHIIVPMQTLKIFVTGQVPTAGSVPYRNDATVADYLLLAGGIDANTADPKGIYVVSFDGTRKKVKFTDTVAPGTIIFVDKKRLFQIDQGVSNALVAAGWATAAIGIFTALFNFIVLIQPSVVNVLTHLGL